MSINRVRTSDERGRKTTLYPRELVNYVITPPCGTRKGYFTSRAYKFNRFDGVWPDNLQETLFVVAFLALNQKSNTNDTNFNTYPLALTGTHPSSYKTDALLPIVHTNPG
jgi:hypothetical protein